MPPYKHQARCIRPSVQHLFQLCNQHHAIHGRCQSKVETPQPLKIPKELLLRSVGKADGNHARRPQRFHAFLTRFKRVDVLTNKKSRFLIGLPEHSFTEKDNLVMVVTFEGQDYGYLYPRARRPEGNEPDAPMNPIACLFLDRAHREPVRAAVVVRDINTGVEGQAETAAASGLHSGTPTAEST